MALEIENGYPVLNINLGDGPEQINNNHYVSDGKWYQAIMDRWVFFGPFITVIIDV